MFLVPLAHDRDTVRRWPAVAAVLVATNVLVHVGLLVSSGAAEQRADSALGAAVDHAAGHPWVKSRCTEAAGPGVPMTTMDLGGVPAEKPEAEQAARDQATMDARCTAYEQAAGVLVRSRFGDVPARGGVLTLFTSQFLHGDWLHLLFNMWFLWLSACNLEDRWGRLVFGGFYLACGAAAALIHRFVQPHSVVPLIGASGAVAGAMGGFLVAFATAQIRFFYVFWITLKPRWGQFDAPAYLMLPLWLLFEGLSAALSEGEGVEQWAHLGGFGFGAVIALGLKLSGVDAKLDRAIEESTTTRQDPRILEGGQLIDEGRAAEAIPILSGVAAEQRDNVDARLELMRAAIAADDAKLRANVTLELISLYLGSGDLRIATDLALELKRERLHLHLAKAALGRLAERAAGGGHAMLAGQCFAMAYGDGLVDEGAVRGAVGYASALICAGNHEAAKDLLVQAKQSPFSTVELDARIEAALAEAAAAPR